ncbi:subtilisin-type proteinase [Geitlerinema sp. FC II]|nr:subtilisin-type proteinase [Geitlerinema sp. FC II]
MAIFSLAGLDKLEFETVEDFIAEAANRASSNSELGHIVISDPSEGARFNGSLEGGEDWNSGSYKGVKTVNMKAGEKFGVMLVPNGRVSEVANNPEIGGAKRPLFSLSTANPDDEFHIGQIADVTGDGNTFVMEDMRADGSSDKDYNDLIFQIRGAKGQATYIGNVIDSNNDWRTEDMGKALLAYSEPYITPDPVQIDLTEAVETELDVTEEGEDATVDETAEETSETTAENSDESVVTEEEVDSEAVVEETAVEETESEAEVSRPAVDTSETVEETVSDTEVEVTETVEETENSTTEPADNSDTTDVVEESVTEVEAVNESQLEVTETVDAVEENQGSNSSEPEFPKEDQPDIGVIDTGFAANNPDLNDDNITQGTDVVDGDDNPFVSEGEGNEHGTHILGIIAAEQDNGEGIDGINDDAPIWVGRAVGSGKWAESLVEFVDHAKESDQPNAVANLSFDLTQVDADGNVTTRYEFTPQEREAIEYARQNGVLLVVAAGNNADVMSVLGQASQEFDNILTVGAAEQFDPDTSVWKGAGRTEYSSYGRGLDVMAYGGTPENPELSLTGDGLGTMAGSSVATAKVTGAVSQVWAANPELSYRQVIEIVKDTATDLGATGRDLETGAGLVNMTAAVLLAKATKPEEYDPAEFLIPNTWGGEGKVTASERAAKSASFSGTVDSGADYATVYLAPNREVSPSDSIQAMKDAGTRKGATLQFDAWEHDTVSSKIKYWYRIKGTNYWVADTAISGEPDVENLGSGSSSSGSSMSSSGNKFATAIDLGTISGSQSGNSGWVSDRDTKDYYKFRIDSRKRVEIELYGMSDDANLKLYNSSYSTIEESENGGSRDERISEVLEPGTYYIRVKQDNDGDNTSYRLRISAENVATPTNTSQSNSVQIGGYIVETPIYPIYQQNRTQLGNPTANQYNSSRGSVVQKFDRGRVVSSPQGNFALFDKIADWYGFTGNIVGLPIGEEFIDSNGYRHQLFENGGIYYNPSNGKPTTYQYGTAADPGVNSSSGSSQTPPQTPPQTPVNPPSNTPSNNFSDRFLNVAAQHSFLGSSISELQDSNGFMTQYFEHGHIVWNGQKFVVYKYSSHANPPTFKTEPEPVTTEFEIGVNYPSSPPSASPTFYSGLPLHRQREISPVLEDAMSTISREIVKGPSGSSLENGFTVEFVSSNLPGYAGLDYNNGKYYLDVTPAFFNLNYNHQKKVLIHELIHGMGFGRDDSIHFLNNIAEKGGRWFFVGENAKEVNGGNDVPLMANFYETEAGFNHWDENQFGLEIMTAATLEGISDFDKEFQLTLAALKDMGFTIAP